MKEDNVVSIESPEESPHDLLTEVLRTGAKQLLAQAVEAEVEEFLSKHKSHQIAEGKARFVRNGHLPEREIQTGIGDVPIAVPRVRDRAFEKDGITFGSSIIPKYLRRTGDLNELLPILYLKGLSTNDFVEALTPLVGDNAKNLSPGVISRLKSAWEQEYNNWNQRDLTDKHYVYFWADGIYLKARMEEKQCVLVVMGVTETGKKELVAIEAGYRESKQSWFELLTRLQSRGLSQAPRLAVGDGALGFWGALTEVFPDTVAQRCWFHKMGNVLDKLPKSLQSKAKAALQEIWMSDTRKNAYKAFDAFIQTYEAKYPKAAACLAKDKDELLAFYDFPAAHWVHIRTTNPIESTFATVRHRSKKAKGCFSQATILTMVFKLAKSAEKRWYRIKGFDQLANVINGIKFVDGVRANQAMKNDNTQQEVAA